MSDPSEWVTRVSTSDDVTFSPAALEMIEGMRDFLDELQAVDAGDIQLDEASSEVRIVIEAIRRRRQIMQDDFFRPGNVRIYE